MLHKVKLWNDGPVRFETFEVEYQLDEYNKIELIAINGDDVDLYLNDAEAILQMIRQHEESKAYKFPVYYEYKSVYYMITAPDKYVRVTCFEKSNEYGISTEIVIYPTFVMKNGKEINQYDFVHHYTKAKREVTEIVQKELGMKIHLQHY